MNAFLKPTLIIIASVITTHLLVTAGLSLASTYKFKARAIEFKSISPKPRVHHYELFNAFLSSRKTELGKESSLLFIGSSFTWGYPFAEEKSFPSLIQKKYPHLSVTNASSIGEGLSLPLQTISFLNRTGTRPKKIFIEIPLLNESTLVVGYDRLPPLFPEVDLMSYFEFYLLHPLGTHAYKILEDRFSANTKERYFRFKPIKDNYMISTDAYLKHRHYFIALFRSLIKESLKANSELVFYSTPYFIDPILKNKLEDRVAMLAAMQKDVNTVCDEFPQIRCLDFNSQFQDSKYYFNVSHLNIRGMERFAEKLAPFIEK